MKNFIIKNALPFIAIIVIVTLVIVRQFESYPHPPTYLVKDFPLIEQPDQITCGPTSMAMLLEKYGIEATVDEVKAKTKTEFFKWKGQEVGGTCPEYIKVALEKFGLKSKLRYSNLEQLKHYVSQDRPPIVLIRSGVTTWHYVVVIGYSETHITVADPGGGRIHSMTNENFSGSWDFTKDMYGNDMRGNLADLLYFLVRIGEAKENTLIVPSINIPVS